MTPGQARTGPGDAARRFALVDIGTVTVAVPSDAVARALPLDGTLTPVPRRTDPLCGVVEYADSLVPVVDLSRWVDVGAPGQAAPARILVIRDGGRLTGLRVDALRGLADISSGEIRRVHHGDHPDEVFHTVARVREQGLVANLLDITRFMALAASWSHDSEDASGGDAAAMEEAAPVANAAAATRPGTPVLHAVFELAGILYALPAAHVAEVIPMPEVVGFATATSRGLCRWRGRHVPVLQPAAVLGVGQLPSPAPLLALLTAGGLSLGIPAASAVRLEAYAVPDAGDAPGTPAAVIVYDENANPLHLVDTDRLLALCPEAAISALATAARDGLTDAAAGNAVSYIVFDAGGRSAVRIDRVEEVLALPDGSPAQAAQVERTLHWRGGALALDDMRPEAGWTGPGQVMVVRSGTAHRAVIVTGVEALIPPGAGTVHRVTLPGAGSIELVTTGEGAQRASYRVVEFA